MVLTKQTWQSCTIKSVEDTAMIRLSSIMLLAHCFTFSTLYLSIWKEPLLRWTANGECTGNLDPLKEWNKFWMKRSSTKRALHPVKAGLAGTMLQIDFFQFIFPHSPASERQKFRSESDCAVDWCHASRLVSDEVLQTPKSLVISRLHSGLPDCEVVQRRFKLN